MEAWMIPAVSTDKLHRFGGMGSWKKLDLKNDISK